MVDAHSWNEYIGGFVSGPALQNRSVYYPQMLRAAAIAVRRVRADVLIGGGAAEDIPIPSFDWMGPDLITYSNGIVIHPYSYAENIVSKVHALQSDLQARNDNKSVPIWATEWSMQTTDKTATGRRQVANYASRVGILMHSVGIDRMHWFMMNDFQNWPRGMVRSEKDNQGRFAVTPAFLTYGNVIHLLAGTQFVRRETPATSDAWILHFSNSSYHVYACWATGPNAWVEITMPSTGVRVVDIQGVRFATAPFRGGQPFLLSAESIGGSQGAGNGHEMAGDPFFIVEQHSNSEILVRTLSAAPLLDSQTQFSFEQGQDDWYYGYYNSSMQFVPMEKAASMWQYSWTTPFDGNCQINDKGAIPGASNRTCNPVRRWLVNEAANVRLTGHVHKDATKGLNRSDHFSACVFHNRAQLDGGLVNKTGHSIVLRFDMTVHS